MNLDETAKVRQIKRKQVHKCESKVQLFDIHLITQYFPVNAIFPLLATFAGVNEETYDNLRPKHEKATLPLTVCYSESACN